MRDEGNRRRAGHGNDGNGARAIRQRDENTKGEKGKRPKGRKAKRPKDQNGRGTESQIDQRERKG